MRTVNQFSLKLSIATLMLAMVTVFSISMWGQEAPAITVGDTRITGLADDWSHHRLVFSNPGTPEEAMRNGSFERGVRS